MKSYRIQSLDLLRGLVMVIMALDHVRDYFHADAFLFNPTDLSKTNTAIFFTRWITHFCAPVFVFLSGTSAYLVGLRKGKAELSKFLLTRGLWLIFIELVITNFGWFFNFHFPIQTLLVIWVIGIGFIVLAAVIHLPFVAILSLGLSIVFIHNAFDGIKFESNEALNVTWSVFHQFNVFPYADGHILFIAYPLLPWIAVTMLGYCMGALFKQDVDPTYRRKLLRTLGLSAIVLFILIRITNIYGDPSPWVAQNTPIFTLLSFINVSKYPPSLLYLLVTLGPALLFLSATENTGESFVSRKIIILGRVPMFYYLAHIYAIHLLAFVGVMIQGYSPSVLILDTWISDAPGLKGYGYSLGVTYLIWIVLVIGLYPLCEWYNKYKNQHPEKTWLSYL